VLSDETHKKSMAKNCSDFEYLAILIRRYLQIHIRR